MMFQVQPPGCNILSTTEPFFQNARMMEKWKRIDAAFYNSMYHDIQNAGYHRLRFEYGQTFLYKKFKARSSHYQQPIHPAYPATVWYFRNNLVSSSLIVHR
jgi:hypothetical protein